MEGAYTRVLASSLVWEAQGSQEGRLGAVAPVHGDIVLAKLAPGQTIELEAHAVKGIGKDHAKFSPVATAAYRLLPRISIKRPFLGAEAEQLVKACPMKVFDIEDLEGGQGSRAVAARPRDCTVCRECLRPEGWAERIELERVDNHFIFSIESTGALTARQLLAEALRVLKEKAQALLAFMDGSAASSSAERSLLVGAGGDSAAAAAASASASAEAGAGSAVARGAGGLPLLPASTAAARTVATMRDPLDEGDD
jgi:NAD-dependent dihydropyrimidine dehydrogenase PreA subunit